MSGPFPLVQGLASRALAREEMKTGMTSDDPGVAFLTVTATFLGVTLAFVVGNLAAWWVHQQLDKLYAKKDNELSR